MKIKIEKVGQNKCVRLCGRLDSQGAGSVYDAVVDLGAMSSGRVVLDLGSVTSATRAGCSAIFVAAKLLHFRTGSNLQVCEASPEVGSVLLNAGYAHLIQVLDRKGQPSLTESHLPKTQT